MSKVDTFDKETCQKPTPADFRYSDLRKIMAYFWICGVQKARNFRLTGSDFYNPENKASMMLHKPHPGRPDGKSELSRKRSGVFKGAWTHKE